MSHPLRIALWINTKIIIHIRAIITSELFIKLLRTPVSGSADPDDEEAKSRVGKLNSGYWFYEINWPFALNT